MKSNLCVSGAGEVDPVIVRQEPAWQISIFVPNSVLYLTFEWYQSNSPPESKYFSNLLQFTVSYYNKSTVSFSQTSKSDRRHHTTVFTACVVILFTSINSKHSETWEASGRLAKKKSLWLALKDLRLHWQETWHVPKGQCIPQGLMILGHCQFVSKTASFMN